MGDFSATEKLPNNRFMLISPKNRENETVPGILIKDSYVPMLSVHGKCCQYQFYYQKNRLEN